VKKILPSSRFDLFVNLPPPVATIWEALHSLSSSHLGKRPGGWESRFAMKTSASKVLLLKAINKFPLAVPLKQQPGEDGARIFTFPPGICFSCKTLESENLSEGCATNDLSFKNRLRGGGGGVLAMQSLARGAKTRRAAVIIPIPSFPFKRRTQRTLECSGNLLPKSIYRCESLEGKLKTRR
jgi:hypothetical protein